MRKVALLFVAPLALVMLSLFAEAGSAQIGSVRSSSGPKIAAASSTATTLPISTVPSTTPSGSSSATASGNILMIKLYVGNIPKAEKYLGRFLLPPSRRESSQRLP